MADAGNHRRESLPAQSAAPRRQHKWKVEFARYFVTPRRGPSTLPPPGLRHISRGKLRHHGTWLPAASPAALFISRPSHPSAGPVLTVSIGDVVYEEHYVSILNFSWPQVTCVTRCPIRGSRVVFMSFCYKPKQIQKFAVRFPQLCDAESFLHCVKECSRDTMDIIPSRSIYLGQDSSASEYIASNGLHHRPDEMASFEEPASDHRSDAPTLGYHKVPNQPVLGPLFATGINSIYSGFHPSFSEMLTNCSTDNEKDADEPYPVTGTDYAPEEAYLLDVSRDVVVAGKETTADKEKGAGKEIDPSKEMGDIMAQIKTYMANDSFHDMLFKLDKVIDELGGDLSL